jgi:hypothetical protein
MKKMMAESYKARQFGSKRDLWRAKRDVAYRVHKEPVFRDGIGVKEEGGAGFRLAKEVGSESRYPTEDVVTSLALEHEHGNGLLDEETDNHGWPVGNTE